MAAPIEVAHIGEEQRIVDLAGRTGTNQEPGFQVDGVANIDDLFKLELLLYRGAPHMMPGGAFHDIFVTTVDDALQNKPDMITLPPHIDYSLQGFAAHHELQTTHPLKLAVCRNEVRFVSGYRMYDSFKVEGTERHGTTKPGRITVFSEGHHETKTKKTMHFFDRRGTDGIVRVNRYENSDPFTVDRRYVAVRAMQQAFEMLRTKDR